MCLRIGITTLWSFQCFSVFFHCTLFLETSQCLCCPQKDDKSCANSYRPISLLCCVEKVFERLIFKFSFIQENNVLTSFQSGYFPGVSSVNQLTFLYNVFCKTLDDGLEVRSVFFDIRKSIWSGLAQRSSTQT